MLRIGFFSECYRPIVNGVVASIDAYRDGLRAAGDELTIVAPHAAADVRLPWLPLPTSTGYRLCVPFAWLPPFDVVHAHSAFVTGWMALAIARAHRIPIAFTYHTRLDAYAHYVPLLQPLVRNFVNALTRAYANRVDAVIAPTHAIAVRLRELGVVTPIEVLSSPVDVARFAAGRRSPEVRARLGARGAEPLLLAVARLGREKNLTLALAALAEIPGATLAIVGAGSERAALAARAAALGVAARVCFAGAVAPAAMPAVYASADLLVCASTSETQGLTLVEAAAAGLAVVAVESGPSREVVGAGGRLAAPEPSALAAAIRAALAEPRPGAAATADAAARFGIAGRTAELRGAYDRMRARRAHCAVHLA